MDEQTRAVLQTAAALATVLREGPGEEVVARAERVLAEHVPADGTVTALTSALHVLMFADRPDRAELWCRGLAEQAADRQAAAWQARFTAVRAAAVLRSGRPLEAERLAARSLELLTPHDWGVHVGLPLSVLVSARTLLGRHEQAAAVLEQFVPESMYRTPWGLAHLHARGHHLLAVGSAQAALADFRTCGELVTAWAIDSPVLVPWRSASAQARLLMGEPEKARALVEEQLALPSAAAPRVRGVSLRVLAATLPAEERPPLLRESVALLRRTGDLGEVVLALADLVAAHRALGDTAAAAPRERQLLRLAQATGLTERFLPPAADPAAPAARPAELTGLLSEAERRVAELAARGHTNRQISRRLFVTVSTVEQHLTRVYRKLHVTRRAELPSFF
jgi:ATP/maltotriose-dependent transcriptional regulator MalT